MIGFCPLASGSKGNALYLGTPKAKILIDVGISKKSLSARLEEIGVALTDIDAVIITHEHHDHIHGLKSLYKAKNIPIFTNRLTAKQLATQLQFLPKFKIFTTAEPFSFLDIKIEPFSVQHDTVDPVGLVIEIGEKKIGICTDLGFVTPIVKAKLKGSHYLYVESNHQPNMVHACKRPQVYKQRVLSRTGHLSNEECAQLLYDLYHPDLRSIYLAHLSSECNHPELALKIVEERLLQKTKTLPNIMIAYQDKVSEKIDFSDLFVTYSSISSNNI